MLGLVPQSFHGRSRGYGKQVEDDDIKDVRDQLDRASAQIGRAWFRFVGRFNSDTIDRPFREAYARGDMTALEALIEEPFDWFLDQFPKIFIAAAERATQEFITAFGVNFVKIDVDPRVNIGFEPGNAAAAAAMREARLDLIREIMEEQRKAIRAAMQRALSAGLGHAEAARIFRGSIGLTRYQNSIVDRFERKLRLRDPSVFNSELRDRRFDASVRRAISRGQDLAEERIQRMVSRYRERFVAMRAETIARTESLRTVNAARHEAMSQLADKVGLEQERIIRTWRSTEDLRTRYTHRSMNGQRRGANEAFRSPRGPRLMYPGDRRAPAEETINCRCVVRVTIKGPEGAPVATTPAPGRISAPRAVGNLPPPTSFSIGGDTWVRGSGRIPKDTGWSTSPIPEVASSSNPLTVLKPDRGDAWDIKGIAKDVEVKIDSLTSWQLGIDIGKIRPLAAGAPPIKVAQINGQLVIMDGNHRAVSAWLGGDTTIKAKFVNFDTAKNKKWYKPKYRPTGVLPDSDDVFGPSITPPAAVVLPVGWGTAYKTLHTAKTGTFPNSLHLFSGNKQAVQAFTKLDAQLGEVLAKIEARAFAEADKLLAKALQTAEALDLAAPGAFTSVYTSPIKSVAASRNVKPAVTTVDLPDGSKGLAQAKSPYAITQTAQNAPAGSTGVVYKTYKRSTGTERSITLYYEGTITPLTTKEVVAIQHYTGESFIQINKLVEKYLRTPENVYGLDRAVMVRETRGIDSVMAKASLPEDLTVFRGVGGKEADALLKSLVEGQTLVMDKAYMSASLFKDVAKRFTVSPNDPILKIQLPKGSRALSLREISSHPGEFEVLIDRDAKFLVKKITKTEVTLELIL